MARGAPGRWATTWPRSSLPSFDTQASTHCGVQASTPRSSLGRFDCDLASASLPPWPKQHEAAAHVMTRARSAAVPRLCCTPHHGTKHGRSRCPGRPPQEQHAGGGCRICAARAACDTASSPSAPLSTAAVNIFCKIIRRRHVQHKDPTAPPAAPALQPRATCHRRPPRVVAPAAALARDWLAAGSRLPLARPAAGLASRLFDPAPPCASSSLLLRAPLRPCSSPIDCAQPRMPAAAALHGGYPASRRLEVGSEGREGEVGDEGLAPQRQVALGRLHAQAHARQARYGESARGTRHARRIPSCGRDWSRDSTQHL